MAVVISEMDVLFAVDNRIPFVLEHRKYGVVGNAFTAGQNFFNWFRGWYICHGDDVYEKDWRCWDEEPTDEERRGVPWQQQSISVSAPNG